MKLTPDAGGEHPQDPAGPTPVSALIARARQVGMARFWQEAGVTPEFLARLAEAAQAGGTPGGES
jgi:hypothetical protein